MPDFLAERAQGVFEAHKGFNPRILFFHVVLAGLLLTLTGGLAYQQLGRDDLYQDREKVQNQRRILVPGPRGNIYDREGRLLVGNRPRIAAVLYLDELRSEFYREFKSIQTAYRTSGDKNIPTGRQMELLARYAVVNRYLQRANRLTGREEVLDTRELNLHFNNQRLLPFTLVDELSNEEYARLIEQLPVQSPLQIYTSSARIYPYGAAAAHTLGAVKVDEIEASEDLPGDDLISFIMKGTTGRGGLEATFDSHLQGTTGGTIYRVDPQGYRIEPPVDKRLPLQGRNLTTSLDIDLQLAAGRGLANTEMAGAAVAIDVQTGEVLALASSPTHDLNETSPRISTAKFAEIEAAGGWLNRPIQGTYPSGSTFKIITAIAGLRSGAIAEDTTVTCNGFYYVGNRRIACDNHTDRGEINFLQAIEKSCNSFFIKIGLETTADSIASEARRFGFGVKTGIELPYEASNSLVPDPAWKRRVRGLSWNPGDTANYAIGQGDLLVTPLQMATFMASFARGQVGTTPTLLHVPNRMPQRTADIGLAPGQYEAIVQGMEQVTLTGTGRILHVLPGLEGLRIAGKTGTAEIPGSLNLAWFIGYAPIDNPKIAIAVVLEGNEAGVSTGGGRYAAPIAHGILKVWQDKQLAKQATTSASPAGPGNSRGESAL